MLLKLLVEFADIDGATNAQADTLLKSERSRKGDKSILLNFVRSALTNYGRKVILKHTCVQGITPYASE